MDRIGEGGFTGSHYFRGVTPMFTRTTVALVAALVPINRVVAAQNTALHLDGLDDGVVVGGSPSLDVHNAFTFEAWIRSEGDVPVVLYKAGLGIRPYEFDATHSRVGLGITNGGGFSTSTWYNAGSGDVGDWVHVAVTFDGGVVRLYRNCNLVKAHSWGPPACCAYVTNAGTLNIGFNGSQHFSGWISELRVWNVARTQSELAQYATTSITPPQATQMPSLVACWNFSTDATSSSGYNHGALVGGALIQNAPTKPSLDCDGNGVIDALDLVGGSASDCNGNFLPDSCDILSGYSIDCNADGIPDECTIGSGASLDCNNNGVPDECDIAVGASVDCNGNGVPDECEGLITTYCTAGTTVHGCLPQITGVGAPSSTASAGFDIVVDDVPGNRYGTIFYGFYQLVTPWAPGSLSYKCIASPLQRTGVLDSAGTAGQCNGELRLDFNAWLQANPGGLGNPFVQGQVFYAQGWFRDPGAPKQTNLSDGLRFVLCD